MGSEYSSAPRCTDTDLPREHSHKTKNRPVVPWLEADGGVEIDDNGRVARGNRNLSVNKHSEGETKPCTWFRFPAVGAAARWRRCLHSSPSRGCGRKEETPMRSSQQLLRHRHMGSLSQH